MMMVIQVALKYHRIPPSMPSTNHVDIAELKGDIWHNNNGTITFTDQFR